MSSENKLPCEENILESFKKWKAPAFFLCKVSINSFEEADDIISGHRCLSPLCRKLYMGEKDPEEKDVINVLPQRKPFFFPERYKFWEKSTTEYPSANPEYSSNTVRMGSYGPWPKSAKKNAEEMSDAGRGVKKRGGGTLAGKKTTIYGRNIRNIRTDSQDVNNP
ncbi:hypothetical protein PR048_009850, partial [Dryococelus australis]